MGYSEEEINYIFKFVFFSAAETQTSSWAQHFSTSPTSTASSTRSGIEAGRPRPTSRLFTNKSRGSSRRRLTPKICRKSFLTFFLMLPSLLSRRCFCCRNYHAFCCCPRYRYMTYISKNKIFSIDVNSLRAAHFSHKNFFSFSI